LPVLLPQLHEAKAVCHAHHRLLFHTSNKYAIAALPYLQILIGWLQKILECASFQPEHQTNSVYLAIYYSPRPLESAMAENIFNMTMTC
jgi:hypothetical protein